MSRAVIVAEIGINHNGSVEMAWAHVDVAASLGVDYVKFQKRTVDVVYDEEYLAGPRESPWGITQRRQKEALELDHADYARVARYCDAKGVGWFATPMDVESLEFLLRYDASFVKIASMDVTNLALLDAARSCGRPVILSTGMSTKAQIDRALDVLGPSCQYLLHCVSTYPTSDADVNLRRMIALRDIYGDRHKIGFSAHSGAPLACFAAACMGAEMVEFHLALDRRLYGSDQRASLDPARAEWLVSAIDSLELQRGDGSLNPRPSEEPAMKKLRRFP